jgi:cupredoxin-like protein
MRTTAQSFQRPWRALLGACAFVALAAAVPGTPEAADSTPSFSLTARDGAFDPQTLEVPANTRFRLEIVNASKRPIEFESRDLRLEKVLAPGAKSSLVVNALKPGTYTFFDDFHPDSKGSVVAR